MLVVCLLASAGNILPTMSKQIEHENAFSARPSALDGKAFIASCC